MAYETERETAIAVTLLAGKFCEQIRQQFPPSPLEKADESPVTIADFGAQAIICQGLSEIFPDDPMIGEEDGTMLQNSPKSLQQVTHQLQSFFPEVRETEVINWINRGNGQISRRYWTLDPIDGTTGFIRGGQYAVALALVEEGEVKVGILVCPLLPYDYHNPEDKKGVMFVAVRGQGTDMIHLESGLSQKIQVNSPKELTELRRIESVETRHSDRHQKAIFDQLLNLKNPPQQMDSLAKYGAVARGEVDIYLRIPLPHFITWNENIWDHAPGAILVEEAGGKVTDLRGKKLDFSSNIKMYDNYGILVSNGWSHDYLLATLTKVSPLDET